MDNDYLFSKYFLLNVAYMPPIKIHAKYENR